MPRVQRAWLREGFASRLGGTYLVCFIICASEMLISEPKISFLIYGDFLKD